MKRLFLPLAMLFLGACASAQVPSFKSFNPTQFSTNNFIISITNSALVTNVNNIETLFINSTNIFNLFAPASAGTTSYWTNILGTLQPTSGNIVLVTNLVSEETLKSPGAFVLPSSISSNLVAGANCIDVTYSSSVDFNGPTTTPSDATVELTLGNTQGSVLFIHNSGTNAFSMINGTPTCDGTPGAYVRLNGDWAATNRGDGLVLYFTGFIWTEVGRFQGGTNVISGDNVWENVSGNIRPVNGNANNVLSFTSGLADNATNVALVVNTTNYWSASGSTMAQFKNAGTNIWQADYRGRLRIGPDYDANGPFQPFPSASYAIISETDTELVTGNNGIWLRSFSGSDPIYYRHSKTTLDGSEVSTELENFDNGESYKLLFNVKPSFGEVEIEATVQDVVRMRFNPMEASSGSAVAYLFDTSNVLTNGDKLASIRNAGVEQRYVAHDGGASVGTVTPTAFGAIGSGETLISYRDTAGGGYNDLIIGVWDDANNYSMGEFVQGTVTNASMTVQTKIGSATRSIFAETGLNTMQFRMVTEGATKLFLNPNVESSGSAIAYDFDTVNVLTNGDKFVSIKNTGTEVLNISPNDTGAQIVFGPGDTNVLYRSGANLVYTNGQTAVSFRTVNGSGTYLDVGVNLGNVPAITASGANPIYLSPANGSVTYQVGSSDISPTVLLKDLGQNSSTGRWRDLHLDRYITWNGTTNNVSDTAQDNSPEGSVSRSPGSVSRDWVNGVVHVKTTGAGNTGWNPVHVGNQAYLAADVTVTNSVTPVTTGLSAKVFSGKRYAFKLVLYIDNATDGEGVRVDFDGGSAAMTNFRAQTKIFDTALLTSSQTVALATDITAATVTGLGEVEVNGSMEPSGDGTFIPRFAENSAGGAILTVFRGSHLILTEIP